MSDRPGDVDVERYHVDGETYLVVDADAGVLDRRGFARERCGPTADSPGGLDGVLFLAVETDYAQPRVVLTLVRPDGSVEASRPGAVQCAAFWAAEATDEPVLMVDTMAGTRRAVVDGSAVTVETDAAPEDCVTGDVRRHHPHRRAQPVDAAPD